MWVNDKWPWATKLSVLPAPREALNAVTLLPVYIGFIIDKFFLIFFSLYIQLWKELNVSVIVYGVKHKHEKDYFTHLGCPIIVDNVKMMMRDN